MVPTNRQPVMAKTAAHVEQEAPSALSSAPSRFVPDSLEEVQRIARMFYFSGLMKKTFYKDTSAAGVRDAIAGISTMILYGAELGLSPMQAMRAMHVIEGQATLSAAGKVALVKRSPRCHSFEVIEESDEHCTAETIRLRADGSKMPPRRLTVRIWWGDAKDIPPAKEGVLHVLPTLDSKGNVTPVYQRFPGRQAKARCTSWLCDNVYEDVTLGLYSAEEVIDFRGSVSHAAMLDNIFDMVDTTPATPGRAEAVDEPPPPLVEPQASGAEAPVVDAAKAEADALAALIEARTGAKDPEWEEIKGRAAKLGEPHRSVVLKAWNTKQAALRASAEGGA